MKTGKLKILLVQLYSNGDCLYATAIARQIKSDFPDCILTWAVASFCKNIIAGNPYVDEVLEVTSVAKNDTTALRQFRKKVFRQKAQGIYDEVFFIHNGDINQAYYDGCIRSSILKAYPYPITVTITPVLQLLKEEVNRANDFAKANNLSQYKDIILFEYAPQSGQSPITKEMAVRIAEAIITGTDVAIILSSANKINHSNKAIIDGSNLTLRETAALTHHCTFLLGTSSGITWISTSDAAKLLPMVQLFHAGTPFENPISRDFERFGIPTQTVIELQELNVPVISACVQLALKDFEGAKTKYNRNIPLSFKTTRFIVYNLLCYLEFKAIAKHIQVNRAVYGDKFAFYKQVVFGFLQFPFKLCKNLVVKKISS